MPDDLFSLQQLGTLAGATVATILVTNAIVAMQPAWPAKIVALFPAILVTVGASLLLTNPITAGSVGLALVNAFVVYSAATGGATMLASRNQATRGMDDKRPFNSAWW